MYFVNKHTPDYNNSHNPGVSYDTLVDIVPKDGRVPAPTGIAALGELVISSHETTIATLAIRVMTYPEHILIRATLPAHDPMQAARETIDTVCAGLMSSGMLIEQQELVSLHVAPSAEITYDKASLLVPKHDMTGMALDMFNEGQMLYREFFKLQAS